MTRRPWSAPIQRRLVPAVALIGAGLMVGGYLVPQVGFPVAALGFGLLAVVGFDIALDRNGAAQELAEAFWTSKGIRVSSPVGSARVIGGAQVLVGVLGVLSMISWTFSPPAMS